MVHVARDLRIKKNVWSLTTRSTRAKIWDKLAPSDSTNPQVQLVTLMPKVFFSVILHSALMFSIHVLILCILLPPNYKLNNWIMFPTSIYYNLLNLHLVNYASGSYRSRRVQVMWAVWRWSFKVERILAESERVMGHGTSK